MHRLALPDNHERPHAQKRAGAAKQLTHHRQVLDTWHRAILEVCTTPEREGKRGTMKVAWGSCQ